MAGQKFVIPIAYKSDKTGLTQAGNDLDGFSKKLAGIGAAIAGAFAVGAIINFGKESILAAEQVAKANARIENIAKSMDVFGTQTKQVTDRLIKYAEANEMVLATDAEVIKGTQAKLLTFSELAVTADKAGGAFDRATAAAIDMAAAGFGEAEQNAVQLGKALQDPINGITALRRSGIAFTESQQDLIQSLVESNKMLEAQDLVLKAIEQQVGGTAAATATASQKMKLAFDNVKETVGAALLPVFEKLVEKLIPLVDKIAPVLAQIFEALSPIIDVLVEASLPLIDAILQLVVAFTPLIPIIAQLIELLLPPLIQIITELVEIITSNPDLMGDTTKSFQVLAAVIEPIRWTLQAIADILDAISNKSPKLDALEARVRMTQTAVNPFNLGRQSYQGNWGVPQLAEGGVIQPRPGGTLVNVGEAGQAEAVIPLSKMGSMGTTVVINGNVGYDAVELAREIARRQAQVNALSGVNRLVGVS